MLKQLFLFIFITSISFSQTEKVISGKVICQKIGVPNIQITNLVNEKSCVSDEFGNFSILAKPDDMLVLVAENYYYKRKILEIEDFNVDRIIINIDKKIEVLNEVFVSKKSTTSPFDTQYSGVKSYTPAERRLKSAQSGIIDGLLNAISGRTNQLKKQLAVERNEMLLEKIKYLYQDEYYVKKLKISQEQIAGFQYYVIYDFKLIAAVKAKNKTLINFRMIELAQEYNKLQVIKD